MKTNKTTLHNNFIHKIVRHLPDSTVAKVHLKLVSFAEESICSHATKCGQAANACKTAFKKHVFPRLTSPASLPLLLPEPVDGPQNIKAPTTAAAVKPAATKSLSDSISCWLLN